MDWSERYANTLANVSPETRKAFYRMLLDGTPEEMGLEKKFLEALTEARTVNQQCDLWKSMMDNCTDKDVLDQYNKEYAVLLYVKAKSDAKIEVLATELDEAHKQLQEVMP